MISGKRTETLTFFGGFAQIGAEDAPTHCPRLVHDDISGGRDEFSVYLCANQQRLAPQSGMQKSSLLRMSIAPRKIVRFCSGRVSMMVPSSRSTAIPLVCAIFETALI